MGVVDRVCCTTTDAGSGTATAERDRDCFCPEGAPCFCSAGCPRTSGADPDRYVPADHDDSPGHDHHEAGLATSSAPAPTRRPDATRSERQTSGMTARRSDGWAARALARSRRILEDLFGPVSDRVFDTRFWDGTVDACPEGQAPRLVLVLRHPGALRSLLLPPTEAAMGACYVGGHIDLEGDIEAAADLAEAVSSRGRGALVRAMGRAVFLPRGAPGASPARDSTPTRPKGVRHSQRRDAVAVRSHYDVGNDFFRLFLDQRLVYSCAYFTPGVDDLDAAQEAKLEYVCRKLRLRPGDRLLDIGCGWGSLVQFAAERFGVESWGITLSEPQARLARARIAAAGLQDRCHIEVRDYRDIEPGRRFDKIASVGMVEHVGRSRLGVYFREVERLLEPGGLFLNHGIVSLEGRPGLVQRVVHVRTSFIQRFVFPDGELVPPSDVITPGESVGLELRDVESLREHYATTLRHWVRRLQDRRAEAVALVGEQTFRVWRLYMAGSAHMFTAGKIGVVQWLWAKPAADGSVRLPPTRADLYGGDRGGLRILR